MQCRELETLLAEDGLSPLSRDAQEHLAGCATCRDLVADLSAIVTTARRLPTEVNPPERIWVSLRAQLEAEGIAREAVFAEPVATVPWWSTFSQFFRPSALMTAAAALLVITGGIYLAERQTTISKVSPQTAKTTEVKPAQIASNAVPPTSSAPAPGSTAPKHQATALPAVHPSVPPEPRESRTELAPSPSESAYGAVLTATENDLPRRKIPDNAMVDASLQENLHTINEFIAECEARLRQNPRDQLTREYLNMAYQQKAELLSAMMDN
jgi:hypothetical protein